MDTKDGNVLNMWIYILGRINSTEYYEREMTEATSRKRFYWRDIAK